MPWEQLAILIIIGLISFVNWVMQKSAEHKEARRLQERIDRGESAPEVEPDDDFGGESERAYQAEEQRRRFMEALGLPVDEAVGRPQQTARREEAEQEGPVRAPARSFLHKLSGDLERRLAPAPIEREVVPPPIVAPRLVSSARRHREVKKTAAPLAPGGQLEFLSEPGGLRKAVLAQEVLGRCKGLSFDL